MKKFTEKTIENQSFVIFSSQLFKICVNSFKLAKIVLNFNH